MNNDNNLQNTNGVPVQGNVPVQQPQPAVTNEVQVGVPSASVVPNPVPEEVVPAPVQNEVIPGPTPEEAIPASNTEQVILETAPKKAGGNFMLIVVVLLLVLAVVYIDDVIQFIEENIIATNPTDVSDADSDNLVGGYILLNDTTGSMKVNSIKFYNFKKNNDKFTVTLNYESLEQFDDIASENIYIEFYNSNKEVLYKSLFVVDGKIEKNVVRTYSVSLDSEVLQSSLYALVKVYSKDELSKTSSLSCKYKTNNAGFTEVYKHDFSFKNDMLVSYTVNKKVEVTTSSAASTRALNDIETENNTLVNAGLSSTYSEGSLVYTINLETLEAEYIPLYTKGTTSISVKNKEVFKKWECE